MVSRDFNYLRDLVREHSAIVLDDDKGYLLKTRLQPIVRSENLSSLADLVRQMRGQSHNGLRQRVIEAMTTNETFFFRDQHPFEALKKHVIPDLLEKRNSRPLEIWSSACSSGQEPYSIAMLLEEHFPTSVVNNVHILATDLSSEMLEQAKAGRYGKLEVNRGLPAPLLDKYFDVEERSWQIKKKIRRMVDFRLVNLAEAWPSLPTMDIILLRNVLIYFDLETKQDVLRRVRRVLRPDGYLFLGAAETTLNLDDAFERITLGGTVCYQLHP